MMVILWFIFWETVEALYREVHLLKYQHGVFSVLLINIDRHKLCRNIGSLHWPLDRFYQERKYQLKKYEKSYLYHNDTSSILNHASPFVCQGTVYTSIDAGSFGLSIEQAILSRKTIGDEQIGQKLIPIHENLIAWHRKSNVESIDLSLDAWSTRQLRPNHLSYWFLRLVSADKRCVVTNNPKNWQTLDNIL